MWIKKKYDLAQYIPNDNVWHDVEIVNDAIYVDGELVNFSDSEFEAEIDQCVIFDRALSSEELQRLHQACLRQISLFTWLMNIAKKIIVWLKGKK